MRARRDAGMHARSRERGRSCRLQSARAASGRVGCYVGKFKFARGKGKQPSARGRDMWATWTEQEWTGWRRDGGRGTGTGHTVQRATERARARARARARNAKPLEIEIEIDDMAMEMGRASPSRTAPSPARIESRPQGPLMVRSISRLFPLPFPTSHCPLSFEASTVPGPGWMSSKPRHPPLAKCVWCTDPADPTYASPPYRGNAGGRWPAFDFASTSSMTCAKKSSTTHLSRLGEVGPPGGACRVAR